MQLAQQLKALGLGAFPCAVRYDEQKQKWHKHPLTVAHESWSETARRPIDDASVLWGGCTVAGVPVPEGVVVIDLDTYRPGCTTELADMLLGVQLPWAHALIQTTIGGGSHYAFRAPSWAVRQGANIGAPGSGIDTRVGGRGFICAGEGYTPADAWGVMRLAYPESLPPLPDECRAVLEVPQHDVPPRVALPDESDRDVETVRAALAYVDPTERDTWRDMGFALKHYFHDDECTGFTLWDEWSSGEYWSGGMPAGYVPETQQHQWESFRAVRDGAMVTIGTLFHTAMRGGWTPPPTVDTARAFGGTLSPEFQTSVAEIEAVRSLIESDAGNLSQLRHILAKLGNVRDPLLREGLASHLKQTLRELKLYTTKLGRQIDSELNRANVGDRGSVPEQGATLPADVEMSPTMWVHTKGKDLKPKGTKENFDIMLRAYGVNVSFDEIIKEGSIAHPDVPAGVLKDDASIAFVESLANLNEYPTSAINGNLSIAAHRNCVNPLREWIESAAWDGVDRVPEFMRAITLSPEEDAHIAGMLVHKWLRAAIAIGLGFARKMEYVLVFVDPKGGAGKTRFFSTLAPAGLIKDSLTLDLTNKDSVKIATSCWLAELGELDGTFRKSDQAKLKAFLSSHVDEMRLPYGRAYNKYPRRTAFFASVNSIEFLIDNTSNRRFWPIRVDAVNHRHAINMQQLWAQIYAEVVAGATWHLEGDEAAAVEEHNEEFRSHSRIVECLEAKLPVEGECTEHKNVTEIVQMCGFHGASKGDLNEAAAWLRKRGFHKLKRNGKTGYMVPSLITAAFQPEVIYGGKA